MNKIETIREQIENGTYETPEKANAATDRMIDRFCRGFVERTQRLFEMLSLSWMRNDGTDGR